MRELDFYEVVTLARTDATERLRIAGETGVVLGKAEEAGRTTYAVLIGEETYSLADIDLEPTGHRVSREDIYSGEHLRVRADGTVLPDTDETS